MCFSCGPVLLVRLPLSSPFVGPPHEFVAHGGEEVLRMQLNQVGRKTGFFDHQLGIGMKSFGAGIERNQKLLAAALGLEANGDRVGQDHRPYV